MTSVFEHLLEHRDEIPCNACGKCCQGFRHPCKQLRLDGLCTIHPAITGEDRRGELEDECNPDADTFEVLQIGYLCEPIVEEIERLVGVRLKADKNIVSPMGEHIYVNRAQLEQVYAMEVS